MTALYRLIQNKDVTQILAQPRLVMKKGRSGGFLAGGEFPFVPGLKVRRTVNRVEFSGEDTLVIAGLLDRRVLKDLTKFPLLGDIPILGALFRSTRFRDQESELVFVITPRIVKAMKPGEKPTLPVIEKYDDPDIRQVPVPDFRGNSSGRMGGPGATIP